MVLNGPKLSKMIQHSPKWSYMFPECRKLSQREQKWSQNVQYSLKWSSMFPNGPKWSKKNYHKFNRMAFITRFNLVLVWSKIVQIFTKKSSKWVRHNQVSWSSFFFFFSFLFCFGGCMIFFVPRGSVICFSQELP